MAKAAKLDIPPAKVKLSKSKVELAAGETMTLSATVSPNNSFDKTVSWSSSDQAVATVAAGKVTAKAAGKATVTAKTSNGKSASCAVTVRAKECAHDYGNWAVDKKATCEEAGTRASRASRSKWITTNPRSPRRRSRRATC
ncbi:MAG: Ig domain-containing protein [Firmicutes bacterium]|nr:Ig domain-containing protein [Bacillota bacterium]